MKKIVWAVITGALFAALIVLLGRYDVAAIGPAGTEVGFSHINQMVHDLTGVNMIWYEITDYIGYGAIAICGMFALAGFVQMIKRRSLLKVDREIWALGGLFIAVIGCYVLFEKYIVNYRPIIMPGETAPEASFPSSHTMLIMTVMIAVMMVSDKYFGNLFEQAVLLPEVDEIKAVMLGCGTLGAVMTGSGSAVFGLFAERGKADICVEKLNKMGFFAAVCETVRKSFVTIG